SQSVGRVLDRAVALPAQATIGNFVRVDMGGGHPGWIANADLVPPRSGAPGRVARDLNHMPPRLELDYGQTLVTRSNTLGLRGRATDDFRVRDMYIFVAARKVF